MIKLFFLLAFLWMGSHPLKADEAPGSDQDFMRELDGIKNPFEDGLPKPVPVVPAVQIHSPEPVLPVIVKQRPKPVVVPVKLPELNLQGVIVGEDVNEAIINDKVVPLLGFIKGAQVKAVSKQGVSLLYKGKNFFLKVD